MLSLPLISPQTCHPPPPVPIQITQTISLNLVLTKQKITQWQISISLQNRRQMLVNRTTPPAEKRCTAQPEYTWRANPKFGQRSQTSYQGYMDSSQQNTTLPPPSIRENPVAFFHSSRISKDKCKILLFQWATTALSFALAINPIPLTQRFTDICQYAPTESKRSRHTINRAS